MELRQLACFVAVAEELSFTRAARRLHVVQSGVSASIRTLERELDAPLFDRTTKRVALTAAGEALLPEARRGLAAVQAGRDAVAAARGTLTGTLSIGTIQSAAPLDLPAVLAAFHAAHPRVTVRLRQGPAGSALLADELRDGQLDLAFLSLPGRPPAGVELRPLSRVPIVVACRRDDELAAAASITLRRIARETVIDFPPGYGNRMIVDRAFAVAGVERTVAYEVADFASAVELVRHGLGIAFLPDFVVAPLEDLHVLAPRPELAMQMYAALPSARPVSAAARALLDAVERAHASEPAAVRVEPAARAGALD